jgi:MFS family permease
MLNSPKAAIVATFIAFGAFVGSHAGALPVLLAKGNIDPFWFGNYQVGGQIMALIGMALGGLLNRVAGHRTVILVMLPVMLMLVAGALFANGPISFAVSLLVLGLMFSFLDIFMNAEAAYIEENLKRPMFGLFHGAVSLSFAVFGFVASMLSTWYAPWFILPFTFVIVVVAFVLVWRNIQVHPPVKRVKDHNYVPLPKRELTLIGIAGGLNVACELSAIAWSGQLLASVRPELLAYSGLGVAFYGLCSGLMRISSDRIRAHIGDFKLMIFALLVAIAGYSVLSFAPGFWLSAFAFAAVGAGLAPIFPCLFALSARLAPFARAEALGYVAVVMAPPRILLPLVLGILAAQAGFQYVFAACMVFALAALFIIVFFLKDTLQRRVI